MTSPIAPELVKLDMIKHDIEGVLHKVYKELETKSSQSATDGPVLIDRAWIGMELMNNMPHAAYLLKPEPHAMAFTELCMAIDDPSDAFRPPDTLPIDPYDPTKPCYLFTIPRELRDMILGDVIESGHPNILQTSKKLHEEGTELLYKHGICRLKIGVTKYIPKFNLQKPIATLIQNVNIEIVLECYMNIDGGIQNVKSIRKFSGSSVSRQDCRVVLLFAYCNDPLRHPRAPYSKYFMYMLQTLIGFSRITLEVRFRDRMNIEEQVVWPRFQTAMMENAAQVLGCAFGSCTWRDTADSNLKYLEFHPRGHLVANPGSLPVYVQDSIDHWTKCPKR